MAGQQKVYVKVQLYSILREKLPPEARGRTLMPLEKDATLDDVMRALGIDRRVVISVNGEYESDRSRLLRDRDEVKIFSSISGGGNMICRSSTKHLAIAN